MKKVSEFILAQVKEEEVGLFLKRLKVHDPDVSLDSFMKKWILKGVLHEMRKE